MASEVKVNLSDALKTQLFQPGVFAYAVAFDASKAAPVFHTIVDTTAGKTPVYNESVTINSDTYNSGKIYFIIQSQDASTAAPNLPGDVIQQQSDITWGNGQTYDFRFDSVELNSTGTQFDVANLTDVNGFGLPMSIAAYANDYGTLLGMRGYNASGSAMFSAIEAASDDGATTQRTADLQYSAGPLTTPPPGQRMMFSPAEAVAQGSDAFQSVDWKSYIVGLAKALEGASPPDIMLSGWFNGAPTGATATQGEIWHNAGYYAYQVSYEGGYFWLKAQPNSQILGDIRILPDELEQSIYATQGVADILYDGAVYQTAMNTGANNQWGAVLRDFFVGFTAGYYGATGTSPNPFVTDGIDLNQESNWDPTYTFGSYPFAANTVTGATYDKYAKVFYDDTNSYGAGYSDYLMKSLAVGPLLSLWTGSTDADLVVNLFADTDTPDTAKFNGVLSPTKMGYGGAPKMNNYISPDGDNFVNVFDSTKIAFPNPLYPTPDLRGSNNISFALSNASVVANDVTVDDPISVELGLWNGSKIVWVPLPAQTDTIYKTYTLDFTPGSPGQDGSYSFSSQTNANVTGTLNITGLPVAADGSATWYQLKVANADATKIFNVYATADAANNYLFNNPSYPGQSDLFEADGLAVVAGTAGTGAPPYAAGISVAVLSSSGYGLDPHLLSRLTDQSQIQDPGNGSFVPPFAPVVGSVTKGVFSNFMTTPGVYTPGPTPNAYTQQYGHTNPDSVILIKNVNNVPLNLVTYKLADTITKSSKIAFGWWGSDAQWVKTNFEHSSDNIPTVLDHGASSDIIYNPGDPTTADSRWNPAKMGDDGYVTSAYTNKIGAYNLAQIEFVTSDKSGTYTYHSPIAAIQADLDGVWTMKQNATFLNGTYKVVLNEYAADDKGLTTPLNKASDGIVFTVDVKSGGGDSALGGDHSIQFNPGTTGSEGAWVRLDTAGSTLHNGTLFVYFTDADGGLVDRNDNATTSLDDAVRAQIGLVKTDGGALMFGGAQSVYLPAGMLMKFAIQVGNGEIKPLPDIQVGGSSTLSVTVSDTAAGTLHLSAAFDNAQGPNTGLALSQQDYDQAWVYFTQGQTVRVDVAGSADNQNTLHLLRIDVDPTDPGNSATWTVNGVAWGNTDAFRAAVQASWDPSYATTGGHGNFQDSKALVVSQDGYYAPVLTTEGGDIFVIGSTANSDDRSHIRVYGQNTFGFEDLKADHGSDWDYNDLVMKLTMS